MISVKYYSNWIKEAGRGHLTAFFCWGGFLSYTVFSLLQLGADTEYTFFGVGSSGLLKLCMGLGLLLAAAEYFYLLQPAKLDFYYSLPVRRGTVFWCRYLHGLIHFFMPFILSMCTCTLYESSVEKRFLTEAGAYTVRSLLIFGAVFLLFYHMGIFVIAASGRVVSAMGLLAVLLFSGQVVFQCICAVYGKRLFDTFYRVPLWERLQELLIPYKLSGKLAGDGIYEMRKVWEYVPGKGICLAAVFWILLLLGGIFLMQKKRKTEAAGRMFAFYQVERAVVFFVSVLAALSAGSVVLSVSKMSVQGGESGMWKPALALGISALVAGALVHFLQQRLFRTQGVRNKKRFLQLAAEEAAACIVIGSFLLAAPQFDAFLPEKKQVEAVGICVSGLDMGWQEYKTLARGEDNYTAEEKMKQYRFEADGLEAGIEWIYKLRERNERETAEDYTFVTVCYFMKNGQEIYRAYPVDRESFHAFSAVYESTEYKERAYPAVLKEEASEERFTWSDGALEQILRLSDEEKEALLTDYKKDIGELKMADLEGIYPCGMLMMESQVKGKIAKAYIYPSFVNTCRSLKMAGIEPDRDILDYPAESVIEREALEGIYKPGSALRCTSPEEIEALRGRFVSQEFDVQTLLCPFEYSKEAEVMIEDPESGAVKKIDCYERIR